MARSEDRTVTLHRNNRRACRRYSRAPVRGLDRRASRGMNYTVRGQGRGSYRLLPGAASYYLELCLLRPHLFDCRGKRDNSWLPTDYDFTESHIPLRERLPLLGFVFVAIVHGSDAAIGVISDLVG
jgi:hypothetical protein